MEITDNIAMKDQRLQNGKREAGRLDAQ